MERLLEQTFFFTTKLTSDIVKCQSLCIEAMYIILTLFSQLTHAYSNLLNCNHINELKIENHFEKSTMIHDHRLKSNLLHNAASISFKFKLVNINLRAYTHFINNNYYTPKIQ